MHLNQRAKSNLEAFHRLIHLEKDQDFVCESGTASVNPEAFKGHGLMLVHPPSPTPPTTALPACAVSAAPGVSNSPGNCAPDSGELFSDFADQSDLVRTKGISPLTVLLIGALAILSIVIGYTFACAF